MRIFFGLAVCLVFVLSLSAQKVVNEVSVNGLELNTDLSAFGSDLFLITGEEEIYAGNPNLKENVLNNIALGIREGLYDGNEFSSVEGIRASRVTLFFYKEELYKIRWFFLQNDYQDLSIKSLLLNKYLEGKYGPPEEQIPEILRVWQGKKRYLQSFTEDTEYQIEYRDEKIHKIVEKLKSDQ